MRFACKCQKYFVILQRKRALRLFSLTAVDNFVLISLRLLTRSN